MTEHIENTDTRFSAGQNGYTLIELIIVCIIIGILATMSVTLVSRARVNAKESAAVVTLNSLAGAWEAYWSRHGTYPHWGEGMKYENPNELFKSLIREGYLPKAYSQTVYVPSERLFYLVTDDYALEIFPYDSNSGGRDPETYYWLLLHPIGFQRQHGYLGIGTTPEEGKTSRRVRALPRHADINQFTIYSLHHN